jgi:deazaflavin-dependent oxidoreductase (nitroreductase family)
MALRWIGADNGWTMAASRLNGTLGWLLRAPVYLYRWRCGWLLGHRFLLLIHIGRRTGRRHSTVLEIVEYRREGPEAVVISAFGRDADWPRNIEAMPNPEVVIGSQHFTAVHRLLGEAEAVRVLAGYQRRNRFIAPIVRLGFSWLLGWKFDGSKEHRRRLAAQLPFIAFRPRSAQSKNS